MFRLISPSSTSTLLLLALLCFSGCISLSSGFSRYPLVTKNSVKRVGCLNADVSNASIISSAVKDENVVVIGGGPVGLASALILATQGHNVQIYESSTTSEIRTFNPALAYLYNINSRGQAFTKHFPNIHKKLIESSVSSDQASQVIIASGNMEEKGKSGGVEKKSLPPVGGPVTSYWIPRHEMTVLLWDAIDEYNKSREDGMGKINYQQGVSCISVNPTSNDESLSVVVKDKETGNEKSIEGTLVVGADGINSQVREYLLNGSDRFEKWDKFNAKKFQIKKRISPASGLKLKALVLPIDKFVIKGSKNSEIAPENNYLVSIRSKKNGVYDRLNLGCLPVKNSDTLRPVNCIARPNHDVWKLKTGADAKAWFKDNFPRLDFDEIISDKEWERFATAGALQFPPCQYSPGLQASPKSGKCGVVLVGDASHSFSPDIGQGINAGLEDVMQLGECLKNAAKSTEEKSSKLGSALKDYERLRGPEIKSLIRIARFGAPYQYNQSLQKDRLGKKLWTANVIMRVLLNKITFGVFPKPMVLMINNPSLSYRQVARKADLGTASLLLAFSFTTFKFFTKRFAL